MANPDMLQMARQAAAHVVADTKALRPARIAATELSKIANKIKANTKDRETSHQDVQRLATGTY